MPITKEDLKIWVVEALRSLGGRATVFEVSKHIWTHHEPELRGAERLLYTWQYDIRWAAKKLRDEGVMKAVDGSRSRPWELA
ncbi:MAG: hypothetical protein GC160_17440 [Acidobacteria bacterium]|nr:hypothetical protein [Acidobacteriota bacterium]